MAKDFTTEDVRSIIKEHEEILARVERARQQRDCRRQCVLGEAARLMGDAVFRQGVERTLQSPENSLNETLLSEMTELLSAVLSINSSVMRLERTCAENGSHIKSCIEDLNPATSKVRWVFAGRDKKQHATTAYHELSSMLTGPYGKETARAFREIDSSAGLSEQPDALLLRTELGECCKTLSVPNFQVVEQFQRADAEVRKWLGQAETILERSAPEIEKSVARFIEAEVRAKLKSMPVEKLADEKRRIRVSALRDNGFDTIADLADAGRWEISCCYGVGENGAWTIKEIVDGYIAVLREETKIRISADDRTSGATGLLKIVGSCICARKAKKELQDCQRRLEAARAYSRALSSMSILGVLYLEGNDLDAARSAYAAIAAAVHDVNQKWDEAISTDADEMRSLSEARAWELFIENPIIFFNEIEAVAPGCLGSGDGRYGLSEELALEIQDECFFPDGLLCELRRYQEWGVKYILHQGRVLLGDEMGLGKTVQAIAAMVSLKNTGEKYFVVVCPLSVLENWCREIKRHSKLEPLKAYGDDWIRAVRNWRRRGGVLVTTYETTKVLNIGEEIRCGLIVVDEAHYIKNPDAQRTRNVRKLCEKSERLLFMTGTALENRVDEMVALISMLQPSVAAQVRGITFLSGAREFRDKVSPVYYRRKREDVLAELPPLEESPEWCVMEPEEEDIYERSVLGRHYQEARRVSWNVRDLNRSCKAGRLDEIIKMAKDEGRKVLVFSFFLKTLDAIASRYGDKCIGIINGSVPPSRRQELIGEFDAAPPGSILVAQIQSGGTGLNIQSASVVVICEPQYKPSVENQAISRAYRMGQARSVLVFRLLCVNTIDERMTSLLSEKQAIFDAFADKSSAAAASAQQDIEINDKSFGKLIDEEIDRIKKKNPELAACYELE